MYNKGQEAVVARPEKVSLGGHLNTLYADSETILSVIEKLTKRLEPILLNNNKVGTARLKEEKKDSDLVESAKNIQDRLFDIRTNLEMLEDSVQL